MWWTKIRNFIRACWGGISHALNIYALVTIFTSGTMLGVLYSFVADYRELPLTGQLFFGAAIIAGWSLLTQMFAPWLWEKWPLKATAPLSPSLPAIVRPPARVQHDEDVDEAIDVELSLLPLDSYDHDNSVYVKVLNKGASDEFIAQVLSVSGLSYANPQQRYTAKWKDDAQAYRRIFRGTDDLLLIARITRPSELFSAKDISNLLDTNRLSPDRNRADVEFVRGWFTLFSIDQPEGWNVEGGRGWDEMFGQGMVPHDERPLLAFKDSLEITLRVSGSRGQVTTMRIWLGFETPKWDYDHYRYGASRSIAKELQAFRLR